MYPLKQSCQLCMVEKAYEATSVGFSFTFRINSNSSAGQVDLSLHVNVASSQSELSSCCFSSRLNSRRKMEKGSEAHKKTQRNWTVPQLQTGTDRENPPVY